MTHFEQSTENIFCYYPRLRKIKDYVDGHIDENISRRKAAQIAGLEEKYFSAYFHQKAGICFKDWIARTRVHHASEMMKSQDQAITHIAYAVGYNDLRTFERAFKRHMSVTPSAYKRLVQPRLIPVPTQRPKFHAN